MKEFIKWFKNKLASKKVRALGLGILLLVLREGLGLSEEAALAVAGLVGTYILGQGLADQGKEAIKTAEQLRVEKRG